MGQRLLSTGVVCVELGNLLFENEKRVGTRIVEIGERRRVAWADLIHSQGGGRQEAQSPGIWKVDDKDEHEAMYIGQLTR